MMAPVFSFLWILGGYKQKNWRRLGVPISLLAFSVCFGLFSWRVLLSCSLLAIVLRLPFTLFGDDIHSNWLNWLWIWVSGAFLGCPVISLGFDISALLSILVPCIVQGVVGTLSNIPKTAKFFPWKACEAAIGFSAAYPFSLFFYLNSLV